jgi:hypothetical protein
MNEPQFLLFVGKKAQHFYAHVDYSEELKQNRVTVYWGGVEFISFLEKDERVVRNSLAVALKNAGMTAEDIGRVLRMSPTLVFRYKKEGVGRGVQGRTLRATEDVEAFVVEEFRRIYVDEGRGVWRKEVQQLVRERFGVELSLGTLTHMVTSLNQEIKAERKRLEEEEASQTTSQAALDGKFEPEEEADPELEMGISDDEEEDVEAAQAQKRATTRFDEGKKASYIPFEPAVDPTEFPEVFETPSPIVVASPPVELPSQAELVERLREGFFSRYAACLLLNPFVARLLQGSFAKERPVQSGADFSLESFALTFVQMNQFGCTNYENIVRLHPEEFGLLAGVDRSPSLASLYRITPDFLNAVEPIEFASRIVHNHLHHLSIGSQMFFIDGHFQRYFGKKKMATGYHPQTRHPQRGYYQYTVSGQDGTPLMLYDSDSLVSFPDSIAYLVPRMIEQMPEGVMPWFVFDRGGYDKTLIARFAGQEAGRTQFSAHYVSWDFHDDYDYTTRELDWHEVILELKGNDFDHPRLVEFKVAEAPADIHRGIWANNSPARHQRRLILRRDYERPEGIKTLCTPICTDNWQAHPADLAAAITWRWRQENAFKLADGDYGFDNISTYKTHRITPEILKDLPEETRSAIQKRKTPNTALRAIDREREQLQRELGRIIQRIELIQSGETPKRDRSRLQLPDDIKQLKQMKDDRIQRLHQLEAERDLMPKQLGRFDRLCESEAQRLDFQKKWMLDILRASAFNARRLALDTWMSVYPNWRDYTERFRDLLDLGGRVQLKRQSLHVELKKMPQPRHQNAAESFIDKIKKMTPETFGIGPFKIKFGFKS